MASGNEPSLHGGEYRQYLPDLSTPRFTTMQKQDSYVYAEAFKTGGVPPWLHALYMHWLKLVKEPFKGVTNDGKWKSTAVAIWQALTARRNRSPRALPTSG